MMLAPLADLGDKKPKAVFQEVVNEAKRVAKTELDFDRFIEYLHVLSNAQNLQKIFSDEHFCVKIPFISIRLKKSAR